VYREPTENQFNIILHIVMSEWARETQKYSGASQTRRGMGSNVFVPSQAKQLKLLWPSNGAMIVIIVSFETTFRLLRRPWCFGLVQVL
jgi:hypothetical protein